jgi:hypothetical protein
MLRYYDNRLGRTRFKRRIVWGAYAFVAGVATGALIAHMV